MQYRLEEFGGAGEPILFAHANGYPAGSYRQFLQALATAYRVTGFHHRPVWSREPPPDRLDWQGFADDLIETIEASQSEPVWMMGHSLGAVVAALGAGRRPELFRGLILIDPVFMLRRKIAAQKMMSRRRLDELPMIRKTLTRPNRFDSRQDAFDFHRGKRAFAGFSDEVLWDYINAGTSETGQGDFQLVYSREWEAAAYRSSPSVWNTLRSIKLPVLGLRGETSETLSKQAFARWGRVQPQADLRECRGGHLLPLEFPADTAAEVLEFLGHHTAA